MKKLFSILFIISMALSLASCGGDDNSEPKPEPEPEPEDPYQQVENPIEGTWLRADGKRKRVYTANFYQIIYNWTNNVDGVDIWYELSKDKYKINKTSFRYTEYAGTTYYRMEGEDILYLGDKGKVNSKYTRIKDESKD